MATADERLQAACGETFGHEWVVAGGGMLICATCEAQKWDEAEPDDDDREDCTHG